MNEDPFAKWVQAIGAALLLGTHQSDYQQIEVPFLRGVRKRQHLWRLGPVQLPPDPVAPKPLPSRVAPRPLLDPRPNDVAPDLQLLGLIDLVTVGAAVETTERFKVA